MIIFLGIQYHVTAMTTDTSDANVSNENPLPTLRNFKITTDKVLNGLHSLKNKIRSRTRYYMYSFPSHIRLNWDHKATMI